MQRYNNVFDCYDIIMEKCIRHVVLSLVIDGRSSGVKASTTMQVKPLCVGLLDYPLMSIELFYESDHVVTPWFGLGRFVGITQRDAVEQLVALGESQTVEIRLG